MKNFFDTAERVEGLRAELWRWEGTPYVAGAAVCGGGGDCVRTADASASPVTTICPLSRSTWTSVTPATSETSSVTEETQWPQVMPETV